MSVSTAVPLALLIDKCAKSSSSNSSSNNSPSIAVEQAIEPRVHCDGLVTTTTTLKAISSNVADVSDKEEKEKRQVNATIDSLNKDENGSLATTDDAQALVLVRDFGYPESSALHYGNHTEQRWSQASLSSAEFTGRQARALYDFVPETEYEIGMNEGDVVWVQYRQCPGWLIADVHYETGLIPESYVEFI